MTETSAADVGRSYDCHTPNCTGTARSRVGRYSYCDECRERRDQEQRRTERPAALAVAPPAGPRAVADPGSQAARLKRLTKMRRDVDRAFAVARLKAEAALKAKSDAEQLQRQFRALGRELFGGDDA